MEKMKKIYLDKEGYKKYLDEIEELRENLNKNSKLKSSAYTSAVGDGWHDNFEFEEAKRQELRMQKTLRDKVAGLSRIVIVDDIENDNLININDYVMLSIADCEEEEICILKLIGNSLPDENEVSLNSPLGKAIFKKKVGELVFYEIEDERINVKILAKSKQDDLEYPQRKK